MKTALFTFVLVFGLAASGSAQSQSHPHGHEGHGAPSAHPEPAAGKKFATDAPLRRGMEAIRSLANANLHRAHEGKLTAAEYASLGKSIDAEIKTIFAECRLTPAADQALHGVLAQMMEGSKVMQAPDGKPAAGLMKIVGALNQYGERFEHQGWTPVHH